MRTSANRLDALACICSRSRQVRLGTRLRHEPPDDLVHRHSGDGTSNMKLAHLWCHVVSYNKPHCPPFEEPLVARLLEQHSNARVASVTSHSIHHLIDCIGASFEHLAEVTVAFREHAGDVEPTVADLRLPEQDLNIEFSASRRNLADVEDSNKHREAPTRCIQRRDAAAEALPQCRASSVTTRCRPVR